MKLPYAVAVFLYCAGIFWLSSQSQPIKTTYHFPGDDKVVHIFLYGGLAALVSVGIRRSGKPVTPRWQFLAPIVFTGLYGVSDELHQLFVPMRTCDFFDFLADTTGATLIQLVLCGYVWRLRRPQREN